MTPIDNCLLDIATQMSSTLPKPHNSLTKGILFSLLLLLILFTLLSSCSLLPCIFQVQKCPVFFDSSLLVSHSQLVTKFCWLCLLPILNICSIIFILLLLPQIRSSIFTWAIAVFSWLQFSWLGSLLDIPHSISFFPKHTQIYHFLAPKSLMVPNVCKTKPKHLRLAPKAFHGLGPSCPLNFPFILSMLHPNWNISNFAQGLYFLGYVLFYFSISLSPWYKSYCPCVFQGTVQKAFPSMKLPFWILSLPSLNSHSIFLTYKTYIILFLVLQLYISLCFTVASSSSGASNGLCHLWFIST